MIDHVSNIKDTVYMSGRNKYSRVLSQMMRRKTIKWFCYFTPTSFYRVQSSVLASSCFFVILFHYCCSNAQVLGTTFVHEFHIPMAIQNVTCFYQKTRWSLLIQKNRPSKTNYSNNYKFLPLRYNFFTYHPIIIRPPYNQYLNYICMVRLVR